ncbi:MAG: hypothetical protein KAH22_10790 [Thiotrichaceae bacterium]|nr:hypothetical protein [Thiotrichaceae bacterium]
MKTFFKVLASIIGICAIIFVAILFMTSGITKVTDKFFSSVKANDYDTAYTYLANDFKKNITKEKLKEYLTQHSLNHYKTARWNSRSIRNGRGKLVGSITTNEGSVIPLLLSFIKEDDQWKIYSIERESSGMIIKKVQTKTNLPSEDEQVKLVSESMHIFAMAVKEQDMSILHKGVSNLWRKQNTVEQFEGHFKGFYQLKGGLLVLDKMSPRFSEKASINSDGLLILKGSYMSKPGQVNFAYKYVHEGLSWKLLGININIEKAL